MKKIILLISIVLLLTNIVFANNVPSKTHITGINPIMLYYKIFAGHYGVITNEGAREIYFPVTMIVSNNATLFYPTMSYRFFKSKQGRGHFHGLFLGIPSMYSKKLNTYAIGIEPGIKSGYRWISKSGVTIAPSVGAGFALIKAESLNEDFTVFDKTLTLKLQLGLGYNF